MIQPLFNWKTGLALIAIAIVSGTIFYSQFLAKKIAREERLKVEEWVEAGKLLVNDPTGMSDKLVSIIITQNKSIPIIVTDEKKQYTRSCEPRLNRNCARHRVYPGTVKIIQLEK